jgi:hypothetical protein
MSGAVEALVKSALAQTIALVSLHSDRPGATGLNEIEVPRLAIEWDEALANRSDLRWEVPRLSVVRYIGLWSAGGVLYDSQEVDEERFTRDGAYYLRAGKLRILVRVND